MVFICVVFGIALAVMVSRGVDRLKGVEAPAPSSMSPVPAASATSVPPADVVEVDFPSAVSVDPACDVSRYQRGSRGYLLCSSFPFEMKPIASDHCLYAHLDDHNEDGLACE